VHRVCFIVLILLSVSASADEQTGQAWLEQADSLRNEGQDAAALDFLNSAEEQFRRSGQSCWVARFAERRARIHRDWSNPSHTAEALAAALLAAVRCPELDREVEGWQFALAQAKLELGDRDEARWILANLVVEGAERRSDLQYRNLAVESMGRLAQLSLEEGAFATAEKDFGRWAQELEAMGRDPEALDAWGWSAVSAALDGRHSETWSAIRDHPSWVALPPKSQAVRALGWAQLLIGARAMNTFDSIATWSWSDQLQRAPGTVDAHLETRWALMRARRHRSDHVAQALAASHQAELAARSIADLALREENLSEALRLRASILAGTGAVGPAYFALHEADSLSRASERAESARSGLFESEPWLAAIGDKRTRMETEQMWFWRNTAAVLAFILLSGGIFAWRASARSARLRSRLRRLQQHWLPGRQHQVLELAKSGARLADSAQSHPLPAELKQELAEFGRLAALCADEMRHDPVNLKEICLALADDRKAEGALQWSLFEEVPFKGDPGQLRDFLSVLLSGLGQGGCRMSVRSRTDGLEVSFDEFTERAWWREAMTLFAGDGEVRHWSLVRLRCDRLGGTMQLDCDAAGAKCLTVELPVYSA